MKLHPKLDPKAFESVKKDSLFVRRKTRVCEKCWFKIVDAGKMSKFDIKIKLANRLGSKKAQTVKIRKVGSSKHMRANSVASLDGWKEKNLLKKNNLAIKENWEMFIKKMKLKKDPINSAKTRAMTARMSVQTSSKKFKFRENLLD